MRRGTLPIIVLVRPLSARVRVPATEESQHESSQIHIFRGFTHTTTFFPVCDQKMELGITTAGLRSVY